MGARNLRPAYMPSESLESRASDQPRQFESLDDPVAWLTDEHFQQQSACNLLEQLIRNPRHSASTEDLKEVYQCLGAALPLHIADEEEDLLPLLAKRCNRGDNFAEIAVTLRENHEGERLLGQAVAVELQRLIDQLPFARPVRFFGDSIRLYRTIRRHLAWETAMLIPLACLRLREPDLLYLANKMARRRANALRN
jgi:hypothetical protein